MIEAIQVLAALGIMLSLTYIYRLMNFVWIYCFRPSSVHKYLHGTNPYAIVTGASDGIGKALAIELYDKGFSLILHGRNEEKTKHVVDEIRARARDGRDVRYFITDTGDLEQDFQKIVQGFRGSNITLVVHNAGGSPRKSGR
jgi:17beta-estradiol 17-dehydrogenase / very-long-chain 3-oxoacyl-CoA reductase